MSKRTAEQTENELELSAGSVMICARMNFIKTMQTTVLRKNVRSKLKQEIADNWVGRMNSSIGLQFVSFKDGKIVSTTGNYIGRDDVFIFGVTNFCNVFIDVDLNMDIQTYNDVTFNDEATRFLKSHVAKMLAEPGIKTYVDNERRFLVAKPWKQLVGLTPEEAINKLDELGF